MLSTSTAPTQPTTKIKSTTIDDLDQITLDANSEPSVDDDEHELGTNAGERTGETSNFPSSTAWYCISSRPTLIIGIICGAVTGIILIVLMIVFLVYRLRKKVEEELRSQRAKKFTRRCLHENSLHEFCFLILSVLLVSLFISQLSIPIDLNNPAIYMRFT